MPGTIPQAASRVTTFWGFVRNILQPSRPSSLHYVLVPFDFVRLVGSHVAALKAAPCIASQKSIFTLRLVAMNWLSCATLLTRDDEIPPKGLAEG